ENRGAQPVIPGRPVLAPTTGSTTMKAQLARRPRPPQELGTGCAFLPAPEVAAWVEAQILAAGGLLHNPDHQHLIGADLVFLWASQAFAKAGRTVLGQAEQVM